jgi:3-oxoacyl-[acyl-carrier protein] reductase
VTPAGRSAAASTGARLGDEDQGRVAFVTGAAGGLGEACCEELAGRGMHVVAADLARDGAERVAGVVRAFGGSAEAAELDVRVRADVESQMSAVAGRHGRLDVLVNLAGVIRNATLTHIDDDDFRLTMASHVEGTLNTMRAAAPTMRNNGYGRIVNMSSIAFRGTAGGGAYGAAKGAIEGLTRSAALELAKHAITVNCVAPGVISAGMFMATPEHYRQELTARVPLGRLGEPTDVAACIGFLASTHAGYITGQTLTVCGGLSVGF